MNRACDVQSWREHRMCVRPDEVFERMVRGGKGSYCFGQNGLFLGILRALGYRYVFTVSLYMYVYKYG